MNPNSLTLVKNSPEAMAVEILGGQGDYNGRCQDSFALTIPLLSQQVLR